MSGYRRRLMRLPWSARDVEADVEEEIRFHIDSRAAELMRSGLSAESAQAQAVREYGDVARARRELSGIDRRHVRHVRRADLWSDLRQDVRFALRSLRRRPGFAATAVLTLALGIGAAATMFAVVDATLMRPLPFPDADRLVILSGVAGPERAVRGGSYPEIMDWRDRSRTFQDVSIYDETWYNVGTGGRAERVITETVSPSYFALLGVTPVVGRVFTAEDDVPGAEPRVLISHDLWQRRWAGSREVLGSRLELDGRHQATVIGVLPPDFHGLSFTADLWTTLLPFAPDAATERGGRWLSALARLMPSATLGGAQSDVSAVADELATLYPATNTERSVDVVPLRDSFLGDGGTVDDTRTLLRALLAAVMFLLLVAVVNVANLQLVRGLTREGELGVRGALGASRGRIVRQLMTESTVIAILGGAVGIGLAVIGVRLLPRALPADVLPPFVDVTIDVRTVTVVAFLVLFTGIAAGLLPALRTRGLRSAASQRIRGGHLGMRAQRVLVAGEVALAVMLMVGAALMVRSLRAQLAVDPGFETRDAVVARLDLLGNEYDGARRTAFGDEVLTRLRALPGVAGATYGSDVPLRGGYSASILMVEERPGDEIRYYRHRVEADYFRTLGIPILRGRGFTPADRADAEPVAVVSNAFAQRVWPGRDPVGLTLRIGPDDYLRVIGIAGDVTFRELTADLVGGPDDPDVYLPFAQWPASGFEIVLRAAPSAGVDAETIQRIVSDIDPEMPIADFAPLHAGLSAQTANARFGSLLLGLFAGAALVLAVVGLYGVMAFLVDARRREIAVRIALGAEPGSVLGLVIRQGMTMVLIGVVAGIAGALVAGRAAASLLYGVRAMDPASMVSVTIVLVLAAAAAHVVPGRRAIRTDPQLVLRDGG